MYDEKTQKNKRIRKKASYGKKFTREEAYQTIKSLAQEGENIQNGRIPQSNPSEENQLLDSEYSSSEENQLLDSEYSSSEENQLLDSNYSDSEILLSDTESFSYNSSEGICLDDYSNSFNNDLSKVQSTSGSCEEEEEEEIERKNPLEYSQSSSCSSYSCSD